MTEQGHWDWSGETGPRGNLREAVALFDTEEDMQSAVDDLECHGFSNAAISRPADPSVIEAELKRPIESINTLEDDARVPREAFVDKGSKTSGFMSMVLAPVYVLLLVGAAIASGHGLETWEAIVLIVGLGVIGVIGGGYFATKRAKENKRRLRSEQALGGLLLWVRTGSREQESRALEILRRHSGRDVHLHGPAVQH